MIQDWFTELCVTRPVTSKQEKNVTVLSIKCFPFPLEFFCLFLVSRQNALNDLFLRDDTVTSSRHPHEVSVRASWQQSSEASWQLETCLK